ncbi:MAG: dienelactone hydrolase family protein [Burkholderiaceae bacterium]|nr:dienelactone hydrolase family protein [Burkholderiaceae bacterium]
MGSTVTFKRPDGQTVQGYLAEAANARASVVVIQEWWGLNDQIRGVADRLALAGYTALVPDLYRGKSTIEAEEAHHLMSALNFGEAASQDIRGAAQYLKSRGGKVGVTGYCMGGALTVLSMVMVPEADAGVVWYGYPPLEFVDASKIKAPLIAHWAEQDAAFPIATVDALEEKLRAAKVSYTGYRYLAQHGFANETAQGPRRLAMTQYDAAWAQAAWDRTFSFFGTHLG